VKYPATKGRIRCSTVQKLTRCIPVETKTATITPKRKLGRADI